MLKRCLFVLLFCSLAGWQLFAQNPAQAPDRHASDERVQARLIFIGGAAQSNADQQAVLKLAAKQVMRGKTQVWLLGDNTFPRGMGASRSDQRDVATGQLQSQLAPFRKRGAAVYFIPGERDWNHDAPGGLASVKAASDYVNELGDSLVHWVPEDGCPGPELIPVSDNLAIIALDTQWWLYPHDKDNQGADCNCKNSQDITAALRQLLYKNRYKTILLTTYHPFKSYGHFGGYHQLKDHLFPLTHLQKDLFIPLPIIGSLYPLFDNAFSGPQSMAHPQYQQMRQFISAVFKDFPNLIHVSGHEKGLQLIQMPKVSALQIVSGSGSETAYTFKGKNSLFAAQKTGFAEVDVLRNGQLRIQFFETDPDDESPKADSPVYSYDFTASPYQKVEKQELATMTADSAKAAVHPAYADVSGAHRFLFGNNYRKEWAATVELPVLRISDMHGGLRPTKLGGGFQSTSLRFEDSSGKEYTVRSVEKRADLIVPDAFRGTFVKEWLDDATSAQHPYGALVIPTLADAIDVAHSHPVIGVVAPDTALESYASLFERKVNLVEEREPLGETDNTEKTLRKLQGDNDDDFDARAFTRARALDYLVADWDRHEDQWRFHDSKKGKNKYYIPIPRDRDMVLNVTQGLIPDIAKHFILMPRVFGFSYKNPMRGSNYYFYKSAFLDAHPSSQFSFEKWHNIGVQVQNRMTDSVLAAALMAMPPEIRAIRYQDLLETLKARRDHISAAMDRYYDLRNKYVDIHASDKNEKVEIVDDPSHNALRVIMHKISKKGNLKDLLMDKVYPRDETREIRLYLGGGDDSVLINNQQSTVGLRLIGGKGRKVYDVQNAHRKMAVYDEPDAVFIGNSDRLKKRLSTDTANTSYVPTNLYNTALPLVTGAYNADDGLFLGVGTRLTLQGGFRKQPYSSVHQLMVSHAFATDAYRVKYSGEWTKVIGQADLVVKADIKAPNNTQNFFGRGNASVFDQTGDFKRYYRIRFNTIDLSPSLRWHLRDGSMLSAGPALQSYHMRPDANTGRFIEQANAIHSYDSASILEDKLHLGIKTIFERDHRSNQVLPEWGTYLRVELSGYKGINDFSKSFAKLVPELALYKSLNATRSLVLSERVGGGFTVGKTTFYQSVFLGGQGNLLGYKKYRFAGQQAVFNNLELRWVLSDFGNYLLRGEIGLTGFYDVGRVWQSGQSSDKWHNGVGGGLYFAPAGLTVFKFNMGYSSEGWYPYFTMGIRF